MRNASLEAPDDGPTREQMRHALSHWMLLPARQRVGFLGALRHLIADNAESLAAQAAAISDRPLAEKLVSEVLPLAEACRWLERNAARVLAPRRHGRRGRPQWLRGLDFEVQRRPFGIVLVIGPGNYPLFLPAVHAMHALAAGNAVRLKPAPGARPVSLAFARLAFAAGLDPALLEVLPEGVEAAREAIAGGVDKVVFTGSSENGRAVLAQLAGSNTPAVMELSGHDTVIVLEDADLDLVARAVGFGVRLNAGETCIAPRRILAVDSIAGELRQRLGCPGASGLALEIRAGTWTAPGAAALSEARRNRPIAAGASAPPEIPPVEAVRNAEDAAALVNAAPFALGAAIFARNLTRARELAARLDTGFVLVNDLIVPTADPRMPFGGVKASGFGTTRGAEGLLEMTFPHVVAIRRGGSHPHLDEPGAQDARLFSAYLRVVHGRRRFAALADLLRALLARIKTPILSP